MSTVNCQQVMMRTSNLLRWAHNTKNGNNKSNSKHWIHTPESLLHGHIAYLVKFLGSTDVEQPKGIEVVKEGIRKLRFSQQLRKAEGQKTPKVELTVSVDGVAIQEAKGKRILHQYPLHRISYCADDKSEKKFFSFIAKEVDSEKHTCYVFVSDKLAEEITLTIGQAFDLAYRRFLETTGRELEGRRQTNQLQENVQQLERQNQVLRNRLLALSLAVEPNKLTQFLHSNGISDVLESVRAAEKEESKSGDVTEASLISFNANDDDVATLKTSSNNLNTLTATFDLPPVPPRSFENHSVVKSTSPIAIEGFKEFVVESDDDFDPRSEDNSVIFNNARNGPPVTPKLCPPPIQPRTMTPSSGKDVFGAEPFAGSSPPRSVDPFGMNPDFSRSLSSPIDSELNSTIGFFDQRITEMREGFSRGISFGGDDFNIESLDPLRA